MPTSVRISVTGTADATYQWFNHGGNKPEGVPFHASLSIDVTQTFPVRNGHPVVGQDRDGDGLTDDVDNCPVVGNPGQGDANLNGVGDACEPPDLHHTTAAFLQAKPDGGTAADRSDNDYDDPPNGRRLLIAKA